MSESLVSRGGRVLLKRWPAFAALAAASLLIGAHLFELAGYEPCSLCLRQREVLWAALAVALTGVALQVSRPVVGRWPVKAALATLVLVFGFGSGLAAYHAGVEWRWWPGPPGCGASGGGPVTLETMTAALEGRTRLVRCDEAAWRFLGLSMAGWNALVSLALAGFSTAALRRREPVLG